MDALEKQMRRSKLSPLTFAGGLLLAGVVFVSMGLTQLNMTFVQSETSQPIQDFHLPPPPPPPPTQTPPKQTPVPMSFDIPVTEGEGDVPLGFLDVDFGLTPQKLTQTNIQIPDTIENFQTDGLEDLTVYDYQDVTEKPTTKFHPPLNIPGKAIANTRKPVPFTYICRVNTKGRATDIHIIDTPYPEAIPYILEFVESIRFNVAKKDGRPVNCIIRRKGTYYPASSRSRFSI